MVDEHFYIHLRLCAHFRQGAADRRKRFVNFQKRYGFRFLPAPHKGRTSPNQSDAQAVFQHMHSPGTNGQSSVAVADIAAQAGCLQVFKVCSQRLQPHIEIVIAEGDILVTAQIQRLRAGMRAQPLPGGIGGKRRTLQYIAAINHQRVAVALVCRLQFEKAHRHFLRGSIVGWEKVAVNIRCIEYLQVAHAHLLCEFAERPA